MRRVAGPKEDESGSTSGRPSTSGHGGGATPRHLEGGTSPHQPPALRYDQRPVDATPIHTEDLPWTPQRDRNIPAHAWVEAPPTLLGAGDDIGQAADITYKRRIGQWLLWRAGPATGADARYVAIRASELDNTWVFRLFPDGNGDGRGPSGARHSRFRSWKEDLRDADVREGDVGEGDPGRDGTQRDERGS